MSQMTIYKNVQDIDGLCIIDPPTYYSSSCFFIETYNQYDYWNAGLNMKFIQDNHVYSVKGVLRGLHVNIQHPQGKLIRVENGSIFDVVVDMRNESKTFKQWYGIELSAANKKQLYIPPGFAHGYLVLSEDADVLFKVTTHFISGDELGIAWNCPELNIKWPYLDGSPYVLNNKDANNKKMSEINWG